MESDDDFEQFAPLEPSSSPTLHRNKLKRLKKASTVIDEESVDIPIDNSIEPDLVFDGSAASEEEEEVEEEWDPGFEFDTSRTKKLLDFDNDDEEGIEIGELGVEISEKKKRSCFDDESSEGSEDNKNKKSKKTKHESEDKSHFTNNKRKIKKRREHLTQLRSESQRLLRETRDATFKPVPIVQKSISSVLEKIRQRKLEISKKTAMLSKTSFIDDFFMDHESEKSPNEEMKNNNSTENSTDPMNDSPILSAAGKPAKCSSDENFISSMGVTEETKQEFRPPIDDTQDLFSESQTSHSESEHQEETPKSPIEEVLAPSLVAMNLKFDSVPPEDISDGENNDKENSDPIHDRSVDIPSSPNDDPVKKFLDDEAEEEDDSDNDQLRFKDDDEDDGDLEELQNMIATGYQEKSIDSEKRNELHQKWLEQQDAAGTEKVLQKLKCGVKQMGTVLLDENEDENDDDDDDDDDEISEVDGEEFNDEVVQKNIVKINLRKAKEMISQMFTDKNDTYVSSDDEEMDSRKVNRGLFEKHREQMKNVSPDSFGDVMLKKVNVPNTKEKIKRSSLLNMTLLGGSRNVLATKHSFLGRGSHPSIPSSKRHGSSKGRSFIFERDDSNSKSGISQPEESFDKMQKEHHPTKTGSAKYRSSQSQSASQIIKATVEVQTGPSLHEILRISSRKSTESNTVCHTETVFSAFKLEKKTLKKDSGGVSIRNS